MSGDAGGAGTVVDVAIVGAGAAGLAAAKAARAKGLSFVVLEASHRIGGRAYTEELAPGVPFDLGCHWMHSASLNPFVRTADEHGFVYERQTKWERRLLTDAGWASTADEDAMASFVERSYAAVDAAAAAGRDVAIAEVTDRESRWTPVYDYYVSLLNSVDSDELSVLDGHDYNDTGENWPLCDGYGALVARWGADVAVALNTAVQAIDWSRSPARIATAKGTVAARRVVVTVSTGVLAAGHIRFDPPLPERKLQAIDALVVGNHNRIGILLDGDPFGPDVGPGLLAVTGGGEPMSIGIKPFGFPYVVGTTGGRFATYLERAGQRASVDYVTERLKAAFGAGIARHLGRGIVTAWGGDPWTLGAYSALRAGRGRQRAILAEPLDERLYFAGEAASTEFFSTCHGARLTGEATVAAISGRLAAA